MQTKAEHILADLFKAYTLNPKILPKQVQGKLQEQPFERTICDYIAGMTDRFALQEHDSLYDPSTRP
jgi:dGTPase